MTFVHGKSTRVLVDQYDFSCYLNNTDLTWDVDVPESTTYCVDDRTYIPGVRNGSMSFGGFYEASSDAPDPVIPPTLGASGVILVSYAPDGLVIGQKVYSVQGRVTNYTIGSPVDGIASMTLDVQGTQRMSPGLSLHNLTSEVATGDDTSIDNGGSSSDGAIAYAHITAWNATTLDLDIEDSADDAVFASLVAFTQNTAVGKERVTVSGTVERYVRLAWTLVGTSATFTVSLHRL